MKAEIEVPDLQDFRNSVDALGKNRNSVIIKTLYLTASRCDEFTTKLCPADVGVTRALGKLVTVDLQKIIVPNIQYKDKEKIEAVDPRLGKQPPKDLINILLIKIPVLKQRKRKKDPQRETPQKYKIVALPIVRDFEPWVFDLAEYIKEQNELCFHLTRQTVLKIVKKELGYHPHHLRHIRVSHLINNYGFTGEQISLVTGWSMRTGFGVIGQNVSGMIDIYLHSQWKTYIRKLLVPLDVVKRNVITLEPEIAVVA